jgi:hypothetical protein
MVAQVEGLDYILLGPYAFASVFLVEARLRRRAFDAPGKLELSAFLCWKHAALHDALNRWIGTRFGDVVAFQVLLWTNMCVCVCIWWY